MTEHATDPDTKEEEDVPTDHLDDLDDGCGCAEVWEHTSERREAADD
ncbi:hypothetical protein SAMN05216388_101118 [Halorientalis persicus]|uniref:Uncharacterized protein n=1 Tax=Halorientalis persicus TaxID=1367881 RepID=A0A1H8NR14_9EURY|nr:hypothetical protein [Halorientalis persicus]SEO31999.1 hypothetical protein SAMN05216388_101118 [Halorientalis persicus]